MAKDSIKYKVKVEAKCIEIIRAVAKARENVKSEVERNGKGDMTLGLSAGIWLVGENERIKCFKAGEAAEVLWDTVP